MFIVSEFLSDRRQRGRLDGNVGASVDLVSGVPQWCVLGPLFFILYTSELVNIVRNHSVGYANDPTINAVIPRPLLRSQVMESLNQDLTEIDTHGVSSGT